MSRRILAVAFVLLCARVGSAQVVPTYVQFDPWTVKAVVYRPPADQQRDVAVLLIHRVNNYLDHIAASELSRRGFLVLAMNSRFDNNEASVVWELLAQDVKTGVQYLRRQPGIRRVVLFGHSGGGPTLSYYQAVAEKGEAFCNTPEKLSVCDAALADLPKADGLILVDASLGNPVWLLRGLNPAVTTEGDPNAIDPALDPFNPANGFNPDGPSSYSPQFVQKYYAAQSARMNRLIAMATSEANKFGTPQATFPDDGLFFIVRARGASLREAGPVSGMSTTRPRKLLKNDGTVTTEVIHSVGQAPKPDPALNAQFEGGVSLLTLKSFMTANAIRSTDSMTGIDWCSSNDSTPCAIRQISVPLLVSAMGGGTALDDSEMLYEMAISADKDFIVAEGATHNIEPCTACETRKGQYDNVTKNYFDYVARWLNARF